MKEALIKKTNEIYRSGDELRRMWEEYVRNNKEVPLDRSHITLLDGVTERMDKMIIRNGEVLLVDQFGNMFSLWSDCGLDTLMELCDVVFANEGADNKEQKGNEFIVG